MGASLTSSIFVFFGVPAFCGHFGAAQNPQVFIDNVTKSQNQRKQKELGESADSTECALKFLSFNNWQHKSQVSSTVFSDLVP